MFAVQLEHALQRWLPDGSDSRVSQMFANQQTEGAIAFHAARGELPDALDAAMFEVRRQQNVGTPDGGREEFHSDAEFVDEHQLLHTRAGQRRLEFIAYRRQGQRVEAHR